MKRRAIVLGGAATATLAATRGIAQQVTRRFRVGVISPLTGLGAGPYLSALRDQLAKHGFVEGQNLSIEARPWELSESAIIAATEVAALKPDAIMAFTTPPASAALAVTSSVPIVFTWVADPVRGGLVKDLARPGGNVTGVTNRFFDLAAKRVELLRDGLPSAKRVAVIAGYFDPILENAMQSAQSAADRLGFEIVRVDARGGWGRVVHASLEARAQALLVLTPFPVFGMRITAEQIVKTTIEQRIPAVFSDIETVELGGLMSYGTNLADDVRRGADLLARVLRGEKPADMAVDQASRFELGINLRTARAIGLTIPHSVLVRADRIVE